MEISSPAFIQNSWEEMKTENIVLSLFNRLKGLCLSYYKSNTCKQGTLKFDEQAMEDIAEILSEDLTQC